MVVLECFQRAVSTKLSAAVCKPLDFVKIGNRKNEVSTPMTLVCQVEEYSFSITLEFFVEHLQGAKSENNSEEEGSSGRYFGRV